MNIGTLYITITHNRYLGQVIVHPIDRTYTGSISGATQKV